MGLAQLCLTSLIAIARAFGELEIAMADINTALEASKEAIELLIVTGERCGPAWTRHAHLGRGHRVRSSSTSQRSLEESANMAAGRRAKLPSCRRWFTRSSAASCSRGLRRSAFPRARTNKATNPASGPATAAEGHALLETAHPRIRRGLSTVRLTRRTNADHHLRRRSRPRTTCASWNSSLAITASRWADPQ